MVQLKGYQVVIRVYGSNVFQFLMVQLKANIVFYFNICLRFQFLMVQLKAALLNNDEVSSLFQFLMVQLKVYNHGSKKTKNLVSIPNGSIKR